MSKPRSRLIARADHEFRNVRGLTTVLHFGKQAKHMPGQPNHDASKSTITLSIMELQHLVELNAGTGTWYPPNREVVDFGVVIGMHRNSKTGHARPSTRGTIHYSKTGAHVVPTTPDKEQSQ
jgi:hypothetical protein